MARNIFENAYFGKAYKTRDGRKAIYLANVTNDKSDLHRTYVEGADRGENYLYVHSSGRVLKDVQNALDIVLEWEEPIDEDKLAKLSDQERIRLVGTQYGDLLSDRNKQQADLANIYKLMRMMFKSGYRAAKQE